jgi:hypothetical protein
MAACCTPTHAIHHRIQTRGRFGVETSAFDRRTHVIEGPVIAELGLMDAARPPVCLNFHRRPV